jgi:hypothetical protein
MDWSRVVFTQHMTEAAALEATCDVVFDFGPDEQATYRISVFRVLKGSGAPYFATGESRADPTSAFRPFGEGDTADDALQACLESAGIHHRRRERQQPD